MKRILCISHDATRTGAPIQLFNLARGFREHGYDVSCHLVFDRGELRRRFTGEFQSQALYPANPSPRYAQVRQWQANLRFRSWLRQAKPDLVFINSVASVRALQGLLPAGLPVVFRMPEMADTLPQYAGAGELRDFIARCTAVIVPSEATRTDLETYTGTRWMHVHVIGGFCPPQPDGTGPVPVRPPFAPGVQTIVAAAGLPGWRKGADLFIQTARIVAQHDSSVGFLWIGADLTSRSMADYLNEVNRLGLQQRVIFHHPVDDIRQLLKGPVIFGLFSREDPLPIVALEAGEAGIPVLCFQGTGGIPDRLEAQGSGNVIPYGDLEKAAARILALAGDPELYRDEAARWSAFVAEHHTYQTVLSRILAVVKGALP